MCFHHLTRLERPRGLLLHVVQRTRIKDLEIFGTELDVQADLCVRDIGTPSKD